MKHADEKVDWPVFRYGQENLRERSLETVLYEREYYPFNHLYGGAEILRQYAGLPDDRPVPWALHAVMRFVNPGRETGPDPCKISKGARKQRDSGMPFLLTIGEARAQELRKHSVDEVAEIGAIFHYSRELYRRKGHEADVVSRSGTIALPDKSDLFKLLDFDREAYARKLAGLPEEFQPVYVSMHWRDYERGCHEPYLRAGLSVICSGHPNDPLFYERLYDIFRNFKYACSNEISTSFALSVLSGCRFFFLDGGMVTIKRPAEDAPYVGPEPTLDNPQKKACIEASPMPPSDTDVERQREFASQYSGERFLRPPEFFRNRWDCDREALSILLEAADFSLDEPVSPAMFARWLPFGFDGDGWADSVCGLEVPCRDGFSGIELELMFPPGCDAEGALSLEMTFADDPSRSIQFPINRTMLKIPISLRADGGRRKIDLHGPPPEALNGEARKRSFRLCRIRWIPVVETQVGAGPGQSTPAPPPGMLGRILDSLKCWFSIRKLWEHRLKDSKHEDP